MVRIEEGLYERLKDKKRDDETFSEAIERLTGDYTLVDFADEFADGDGSSWEEHKEAIEAAEAAQNEEMAAFHDESEGSAAEQ
ncbi:hypothetical protein DM867_11820 [Halosegnis rubeus]|uniref:Antitoxin n=2 Tax=Halosegnis rubeus TaxID=2212850 RepID=A0A5N5U345_9EURY|nr:hypothetical protein DM867_11820 [Halosegnis rubeus]KAB7512996.1 hypothetical protein DMP03_13675 [Halosegnis rubeus]KAB7513727.1 hypothetical protein DP108_12565 [Halosegnis rubeus]